MPLLHINLSSEDQVIELMHDLKPQSLILRQVIINKDVMGAMSAADEGLQIDLRHMFNGYELLSNVSSDNKLYIPVHSRPLAPTPAPFIYPFHLKMTAEEIKSRFVIKCFKKDGFTPVSFNTGTDGHYKSIDLYFEFETAQHFETIHTPGGLGVHQHV
jgi:hypothetical protein